MLKMGYYLFLHQPPFHRPRCSQPILKSSPTRPLWKTITLLTQTATTPLTGPSLWRDSPRLNTFRSIRALISQKTISILAMTLKLKTSLLATNLRQRGRKSSRTPKTVRASTHLNRCTTSRSISTRFSMTSRRTSMKSTQSLAKEQLLMNLILTKLKKDKRRTSPSLHSPKNSAKKCSSRLNN